MLNIPVLLNSVRPIRQRASTLQQRRYSAHFEGQDRIESQGQGCLWRDHQDALQLPQLSRGLRSPLHAEAAKCATPDCSVTAQPRAGPRSSIRPARLLLLWGWQEQGKATSQQLTGRSIVWLPGPLLLGLGLGSRHRQHRRSLPLELLLLRLLTRPPLSALQRALMARPTAMPSAPSAQGVEISQKRRSGATSRHSCTPASS